MAMEKTRNKERDKQSRKSKGDETYQMKLNDKTQTLMQMTNEKKKPFSFSTRYQTPNLTY